MYKEGKIGKVILLILAIIGIIFVGIIIWAIWFVYSSGGADKNFQTVEVLERDYIQDMESFDNEYVIAFPDQIASDASLSRAVDAYSRANLSLQNAKENASEIKNLASTSKSKYKGDKAEWMNKVELCYEKRMSMIESYNKLFKNAAIYYVLSNESLQLLREGEEFQILLGDYVSQSSANDKENVIKSIKLIKENIKSQREIAQRLYDVLPVSVYEKYIRWTKTYEELMDISLKIWQSQSSLEQSTLLDELDQKSAESSRLLTEIGGQKAKEEVDDWTVENISNFKDTAERDRLTSDQVCEDASKIYEKIFPTGNVVQE